MKSSAIFIFGIIATIPCLLNAQDTTSGLVALYEFDGNLNDTSSGLNLAPGGTFAFVTDRNGKPSAAVQLVTPASNGTFFLGTGPNLAHRSSSVAFWVRKDYSAGGWVFGLGYPAGVPGASGQHMHVGLEYGNSIRYSFFYNDFDVSTPLSQNVWHHLAFTYDYPTGTRKIYVNGALIATNVAPVPFSGGTSLKMGFAGLTLDDFRFYARVLSASDVAVLATPPPDPLQKCEDRVGKLTAELAALDAENARLSAANAQLTSSLAALQMRYDAILSEKNALAAQNASLTATNAALMTARTQAIAGLDEVLRLLALPPGGRTSTARFGGQLGEQINRIIDALLAPPGKNLPAGK